ncbi:unnamed protein product, partial [Brachionus calyciflorus]
MHNNCKVIYNEVSELEARKFFIQDVYSTIISEIYDIHPDILKRSSYRVSRYLKCFHERAVRYCESLQKDLDLFSTMINEIDFQNLDSLKSNEESKDLFTQVSHLYNIQEQLILESSFSKNQSILVDTIIEETDYNNKKSEKDEESTLKNSNVYDFQQFPTPNSLLNDFRTRYGSTCSSNKIYTSTEINGKNNKIENISPIEAIVENHKEIDLKIQEKKDVEIHLENKKNRENEENINMDVGSEISYIKPLNLESKTLKRFKKNPSSTNLSASVSTGSNSKKIGYRSFTINLDYDCYVTHLVSPLLIFMRNNAMRNDYYTLHEEINIFYNDEINNINNVCEFFDESLLYAVKYTYDDKWYRARVLSINENENTANVFYVDYGNCEELSLDRIRNLDDFFYKYPILATPVSLAEALPKDGSKEWTDQAIKLLSDLILYRNVTIKTFQSKYWPILFCQINAQIDGVIENAREYLVSMGQAVARPNSQIILLFKEEIQKYDNYYSLSSFNPNLASVSVYSSSKSSNSISNSNVTCKKFKNSNSNSKNDKNINHNDVQVEELELTPYEKCSFNLDELPLKILTLDKENCFKFEICKAYSPEEFYVNFAVENFAEYQKFENELNDFYNKYKEKLNRYSLKKKFEFVYLNSVCMVQSPKNQYWYRALIIELNPKSLVKVIYIDYGVYDSLDYSNIYPLLKKFTNMPPFTIKCQLDLFTSYKKSWTEKEIGHFLHLIKDHKLFKAKVYQKEPEIKINFQNSLKICFVSLYDKKSKEKLFELNDIMIAYSRMSENLQQLNDNEIDHLDSASCNEQTTITRMEGNLNLELPKEDFALKHQRICKYIMDCSYLVDDDQPIDEEPQIDLNEEVENKIDNKKEDKNNFKKEEK